METTVFKYSESLKVIPFLKEDIDKKEEKPAVLEIP